MTKNQQASTISDEGELSVEQVSDEINSKGRFMSECCKRRIFKMALQCYPHIQSYFNKETLSAETSMGFFQMRPADGQVIWSQGMFKLAERDPILGTPKFPDLALKFFAPEHIDSHLAEIKPLLEGKVESVTGDLHTISFLDNPYILKYIMIPSEVDADQQVIEVCGFCWSENQEENLTKEPEASSKEILLEKAIIDKNNFIAYVFHEVRNPVNAVYLGLQALEEELNDPELKELVAIMRNSTERAISILNDTLDYSKFELGNVNLRKVPMKISECVRECVNSFKASTQKRNISLSMNLKCDSICEIDVPRIIQVFNNLLSNALKFTPDNGSITVTVTHTSENGGEWAKIAVTDSGVGINEEDRERIFAPYNQLDNQISGMKGMGIGLSISKKIVDAHYGDISIQPADGHGSKFVVKLPAMQPAGEISSEENVEKKRIRVRGEMEGLSVLLVDDDLVNLSILKRMLTKHGCAVDTLKDGEEFLKYTRDPKGRQYNMILLDDFMPNLDGSKAINIARREGFKLFTVLLTGNTRDERINTCGANDLVYKPLKFTDLKAIVNKYLL